MTRAQRRAIPFGIALALTLAVAMPAMSAEAAPAKNTKSKVVLSGALEGSGYSISPKAILETSTKYKETTMTVRVLRTNDPTQRTPIVTVSLRDGKLVCETGRSWIWSTDEGSTLTLLCDKYVKAKTVKKTKTGVVL